MPEQKKKKGFLSSVWCDVFSNLAMSASP